MAGNLEERRPGVWRIRVSAGVDKVTGTRRVINKTVHGTKQEAELALARVLIDVGDGAEMGTAATVADLFAAWLPQKQLAPTTAEDWRRVVDLHIVPRIGDIPLRKLTVFAVDRLYADLAASGVSPVRIRKVHTVLRAAMQRAVKWTWIPTNPCSNADLPPLPETEAVAPAPAVVADLFDAALKDSFRLYVMLRLAASLGCRRGELCGLQWDDIDLDAGVVYVRRSVGVVKTGPYEKQVKNKKRRASAPIPTSLVNELRRWRAESAEARLAAGNSPWVFTSTTGDFYRPEQLTRLFRQICDQVGVPDDVKLHGLRHYVGTHMRDDGIDHDVISRLLGHARTSTTLDMYGHAVDGRAREAVDRLEAITQAARRS